MKCNSLWLSSLCLVVLVGCATAPVRPGPAAAGAAQSVDFGDPRKNEVALPAPADWRASLVIDNGATGIWTVKPFHVFPQYGSPEVVGLDDRGRCHVLVSYSGKWTPVTVIEDGEWLGGLAHGDVDPRTAGAEIYTGGKRGNLYQVVAYPHGALDCRLIAHLPGMEIHTIVAGDVDRDVDAAFAGPELLVFTRPGGLYRVTPTGVHGTFETKLLQRLPGRIRDAVVLPARPGKSLEIATVTRAGSLQILAMEATGPRWRTVYSDVMGMGRIAVRKAGPSDELVLYSTHDDGRILRHRRLSSGEFASEVIHRGAQGPRGIAAGRFGEDPHEETVAIFGYSKNVELLTRRANSWSAQTIFVDRGKGHWLSAAELDGRNATDEILLSGYSGRIVMLARPASTKLPSGTRSQ